ncbi:MAG TPA: tetrahydrofolate dehydrogenase/cyclohydrolase catalytic domain-containing protein [Abditibacteriaceae bacterium]|jgi:methylenetetrahydrofolate dehydrogenase (NADP+)/methenyltetrahydrofolate cyclohydrolase
MQLLDGRIASQAIYEQLKQQVAQLKEQGITPGLGTILVGDDPASATYIGAKHRACEETGLTSIHRQLPADISQAQLLDEIAKFNADPAVDAYIIQLPLPKGLNEEAALLAMNPDKDADGLHPVNLGRLVMGASGPVPCTPAGIVELLVHYNVPIEGRHVVIVGRGLTIGRPLALLLALKRPHCNAAVTVVHTGVKNLADYTRQADILVAAAGAPNLITPDMIKPGAAVVGGGITRDGKKILSDVDESVGEVADFITPRIGGVGPMTVAMLLKNTVLAAQKRAEN